MSIDPFDVTPEGPLDRLTAYWYVTLMRVTYQNNLALSTTAHGIGGGGTVERIAGPHALIPTVEIGHYPDDSRVVVIQGTTAWRQYVAEAFGSPLALALTFPGWLIQAGSISIYFGALAAQLWSVLRPRVGHLDYTLCGHSLGGVAAALVSTLGGLAEGPHVVVDAGSPRPGNAAHATAAGQIGRLRLTNQGDPVCLVPPSTNTILDFSPTLPFIAAPPLTYRHWGDRVHLEADGAAMRPPEQATATEAGANLLGVIAGTNSWLVSHNTAEYARRLRVGIPVAFPALVSDPDFPRIDEIDAIHVQLNQAEGVMWPLVLAPDGEGVIGQAAGVLAGAGGWIPNVPPPPPAPQIGQPGGPRVMRDFTCE